MFKAKNKQSQLYFIMKGIFLEGRTCLGDYQDIRLIFKEQNRVADLRKRLTFMGAEK